LDNYNNLSEKEKEEVLSLIDQKIADLRVILFNQLSHDYEEDQRIARKVKGIVRKALADEYKKPTQIAFEIIGGLAAVAGGGAAAAGLVYGGASGAMAVKLGKLAMSGSQGVGMFAKVPENFSQAEKTVLQDDLDTTKNNISHDEEGKRESRQTYNRILQARKDQASQEHSAKREVLGR
ncbi:MAG: hypothetical protein ACK4HV_08485, partial [Parachlamydiaceae bacterium]